VKSIFLEPTPEAAADAVAHALAVLEPNFPSVAARLRTAEADVLAYLTSPLTTGSRSLRRMPSSA